MREVIISEQTVRIKLGDLGTNQYFITLFVGLARKVEYKDEVITTFAGTM